MRAIVAAWLLAMLVLCVWLAVCIGAPWWWGVCFFAGALLS